MKNMIKLCSNYSTSKTMLEDEVLEEIQYGNLVLKDIINPTTKICLEAINHDWSEFKYVKNKHLKFA